MMSNLPDSPCLSVYFKQPSSPLTECTELLWHYVIVGLVCLFLGFWLGGLRGKTVKRNSLRELNTQSLELLEAKKRYSVESTRTEDFKRKEKLLKMALTQTQQSNVRLKQLRQQMVTQSKKQYVDESFLRLKAVQSHDKALKAANIARKATQSLKKLELAVSAKQAADHATKQPTPAVADSLPAQAYEHRNLNAYTEVVRRVSDRDSVRLAKLKSSNEAGRTIK